MKREHSYTCINCPLSCSLELVEEDGEVVEVRGNDCKTGAKYAVQEFTDPRRVVTTTVTVRGGALPLLPVRSTATIPKERVKDAVAQLARIVVDAPVSNGQLITSDILGTGVDVISSRDLPRKADGED